MAKDNNMEKLNMKPENNEISSSKIAVSLTESYTRHSGFGRGDGEPSEWNDRDEKNHEESIQLFDQIKKIASEQQALEEIKYDSYQHKGRHYFDGGIDKTFITTFIYVFGSVGGAAAFFKLGKDIILQWMKNMGSRSIKPDSVRYC
jgi:hypothetical protein